MCGYDHAYTILAIQRNKDANIANPGQDDVEVLVNSSFAVLGGAVIDALSLNMLSIGALF
jgi:hypothetical protein